MNDSSQRKTIPDHIVSEFESKAFNASQPTVKNNSKVERDTFTLTQTELDMIIALRTRMGTLGKQTNKSEMVRCGIRLMYSLSDEALITAYEQTPVIKTGRPKGHS